jgi:type III restriction enzyme
MLKGTLLTNEQGQEFEFTEDSAMDLIFKFKENGYIDESYYVTDKLIDDIEKEKLRVIPKLENFKEVVGQKMQQIYDAANYKVAENERAENVHEPVLEPNENFAKKEFQNLWNKIKVKTVYDVDFDSRELMNKSIKTINQKLQVKKITVKTVEGEQKSKMKAEDLASGKAILKLADNTQRTDSIIGGVQYDLIDEIVKGAKITRATAVEILKGLNQDVFAQFKVNPEDFIQKVIQFINQEKAATLINNITYSKVDQTYDDSIFTINNFKGSLQKNIQEVKKHIYDYVKTDSKQERQFASRLEQGEVLVYAKLPGGFKIPTPVGNYNPDWAIVFDTEEVKYVYFIAETKGSMSSLDLRKNEDLRIEYARKHFEALNHADVKYDVVDSYEKLMNMVM